MAKTTPSSKRIAKDAKDKASPVPKKSKKKSSPPKQLSTEVVVDSDDEAESPQEISDDDSLPENPVASKSKSKANGKILVSDVSESPSANESDAESDEEDEEEQEEPPTVEKAPKSRVQFAKEPTAAPKPVAAYKPPTGFEPLSIGEGASQVSKPFKSSKLAGKQLWYFTAPASIPISSIQEMTLLGAKNGDVVYSKDGNDYGFSTTEKEENTYTSILVPNSSEHGYTVVPKSVDQVLHLGPIAKQPGANTTSSKATVPAPKPVRQQPKGLKMRFFPIGFGKEETARLGSASDESSSEEETQAHSQFRQPESVASDSDVEMSEAPPVQSKPASSRPHKSSKSDSKGGSLKRKHGEGSEKKKSKHSSSLSTDSPNNQQLKRLKTKQTESRGSLEDKPSALISAPISTTPIPLPKPSVLNPVLKSSLKPSDVNLPSRPASPTSPSKHSQTTPEEVQQENASPKKSKSKRKDKKSQDDAFTPVKKSKSKNKDKHKERSQSTDISAESGRKAKKSIFSQSTQSQSTQEEPSQ